MNTISSILKFLADLLAVPSLSSTGITTYTDSDGIDRVKQIQGGQFKVGKWRFLQLRMRANREYDIYGFNSVVKGFDAPANNYAALTASVAGYDSSSPIAAYINSSGIVCITNGGRKIQEDWIIVISGWYIAAS